MTTLNKKAFEGLAQFIVALALMLFLPVWTLNYWQAWAFLFSFGVTVTLITLYLMQHDPKLLESRLSVGVVAEKEKSQKLIQFIAQFAFIAIIIVPPVDHRLGWSVVAPVVSLLGDGLVVLGLWVVFRVFKENSFTSAIIEINPGQQVITTGPYAQVRHPMYSGALVMLLGVPLALGSWWGMLTIIPMTAAIIWRLLEEEKFLVKNLTGYEAYKNKVKYRLLPFIW